MEQKVYKVYLTEESMVLLTQLMNTTPLSVNRAQMVDYLSRTDVIGAEFNRALSEGLEPSETNEQKEKKE